MDDTPQRRRGRLWLNIGEAAAVLAVIIAGLSYWDSHREHEAEARREAAQANQSNLATALALEGEAQTGGKRLALKSVNPGQVIESQHYVFPNAVLDHPVEVTAASPGIEAGWIAPGLVKTLDANKAPSKGSGRVPVAITTGYLSNGEVRQDRSLYVVGYAWRERFLHGREITLQGLAFRGRISAPDTQAAVEKAWAAAR
jgi:hypothetical protein